jgi:hypothetical protein
VTQDDGHQQKLESLKAFGNNVVMAFYDATTGLSLVSR